MKALRICILLASVTSMAPALSRLAAQDQPENPKFSLKLNELRPKGYLGKNILITIVMTMVFDLMKGWLSLPVPAVSGRFSSPQRPRET